MSTATTTYSRAQVTTALGTAHGLLDEITDTSIVGYLVTGLWRRLGPGPFTLGQVQAALGTEANELDPQGKPGGYETSGTIWAQDVLNLAVNATAYLLDHPDADLGEIIPAQYADVTPDFDDLPDGAADPEKGSPAWNAAVTSTVLGWVS